MHSSSPSVAGQAADHLLVLLAHNDDEFFISPLLRREIATGTELRVAYLTHGSAYGADSAERIAESRGVLAGLGLSAERILLPGLDTDIFDSTLAEKAETAYQAVLGAVAGWRVDRILTLAWEGGHPDHDAANAIGTALARKLACPLFEFPAYNAHRMPPGLFRVMDFVDKASDALVTQLSLGEGLRALKAALAYRSQRRTFLGLSPGAALELIAHGRQRIRRVPGDRDYGRPPHAGTLLFERRFRTPFAVFHGKLAPFLSAHAMGTARSPIKQDYSIRPVSTTPDELALTAAFLRQVWPHSPQFTPAYLRWLYAENPAGPAIGVNAWAGDTLAGHYVIIPIEAELSGRKVKAALSLNTAVHPDHQGRGLFTRLAEETYRSAKALGLDHVIGVANANSTPGFIRRLGFSLICPLDAKLVWGAPQLSDAATTSCEWRRAWTPESYAWRLANPVAAYSVARGKAADCCLAGTGEFGIRAVLRLETEAVLRDALRSRLPAAGLPWFKLWIGRSGRWRFPATRAMDVPAALRRSPLNLIYLPLTGGPLPAAERLEFTLLDFDAY